MRDTGGLPDTRPRLWPEALVPLSYAVLALAMTWPAVARLGTHIVGGQWDTLVHQWNFWWVKQSIAQGLNPFRTDLLYSPVGVSLASHNIAWLNIALWLPLQALAGNYPAYSLLFIGTFAFNAFAMYLLARDWTGSPPAAFIGGLIFGFWPYTQSFTDSPNMILVGWVPLALLYLRRTLDGGGPRDALMAGVFIALLGITRWQLLVMGGLMIGLYVLYRWLSDRTCRTWRNFRLLGLVALVVLVITAPVAGPVVVYQLTRTFPEDLAVEEPVYQADLVAYLLPSHNHPLWGDAVWPLYGNLEVENVLRPPVVGYTVMALALYGAAKQWRKARLWLLIAGVYLLLALGPELMVNGQSYPGVPMPYRLLGDWLLTPIVRRPHRFNLFLALPLGMLAALGLSRWLRRNPHRGWTSLLPVAVIILIPFEYLWIPYPTTLPATPDWYRQLADEPGEFAILDLPMHPRGYDKWYMLYQLTHEKPIVEGHVSRIPREAFAFLDSTPFLQKLREQNVMEPNLVDVTHQLQTLVEADVRYLILHKEFGSPEQIAAWRAWLAFDPMYESAELVVFHTDPREGQDFTLSHQFNDAIGVIRADVSDETRLFAGSGTVEVSASWGSLKPPEADYDACLSLVTAQGQAAQTACTALSPAWLSSRWGADEVVRSHQDLLASPFLETGSYTLTLGLKEQATGAEVGPAMVLSQIEMDGLPREFAEPTPAHPLDVQFGEMIRLRGYDLMVDAGSAELTLYWQAAQRVDASYKVFVHLVDTATGAVAAQDDAIPRQWTYPTDWWEAGEVVADAVTLPLSEVPAGRYELAIGLYEPESGTRLVARLGNGQPLGDALVLTEVQR